VLGGRGSLVVSATGIGHRVTAVQRMHIRATPGWHTWSWPAYVVVAGAPCGECAGIVMCKEAADERTRGGGGERADPVRDLRGGGGGGSAGGGGGCGSPVSFALRRRADPIRGHHLRSSAMTTAVEIKAVTTDGPGRQAPCPHDDPDRHRPERRQGGGSGLRSSTGIIERP
jgi:hypothetical protein